VLSIKIINREGQVISNKISLRSPFPDIRDMHTSCDITHCQLYFFPIEALMEIIQIAIDKLANSMRLYGETSMGFQRLKDIDSEEAINNLDRAFESKLEAFHSLYDVTKNDFLYFDNADTALLILLRNAVHHRDHLLFRSWNSEMLLNDGLSKYDGAEFLLAGHDVVDAPHTMRHYYKLDDFFERIDPEINSPYLESKMNLTKKDKTIKQFKKDLNFDGLYSYAKNNCYPSNQIYLNIIPIYISAVSKVFKALKSKGIEFKGYDAKVYEEPFTNELQVDLFKFNYMPMRILNS
jgi:hypothetical protein